MNVVGEKVQGPSNPDLLVHVLEWIRQDAKENIPISVAAAEGVSSQQRYDLLIVETDEVATVNYSHIFTTED